MKRYDFKVEYNHVACEDQVIPVEAPKGDWVRYEDVAALAALRTAIMSNCYDDPSTFGQRLMELANKTQQQHLRDVRASAISEYIKALNVELDRKGMVSASAFAEKFIKRIQDGEA